MSSYKNTICSLLTFVGLCLFITSMWFYDKYKQNYNDDIYNINQKATVLSVFCIKPDWNRDRANFNRNECNVTLGIVYNGKSFSRNMNIVSNKPVQINDSVAVIINPNNPSDFRAVDLLDPNGSGNFNRYRTLFYILFFVSLCCFILNIVYCLCKTKSFLQLE